MATITEDHSEEFKKQWQAIIKQRLTAIGILLVNYIKEHVSEPSPPPSEPGQPPHRDTGRLRASISYEVDGENLILRVGSNVDYFKFLELGTRKKMAARPILRQALMANEERINAILKG